MFRLLRAIFSLNIKAYVIIIIIIIIFSGTAAQRGLLPPR
jgi:hypothetical protein